MRESELLRQVMDWLAAEHVLAFRMNVGAVKTDQRFFRFGVSGMADILAFRKSEYRPYGGPFTILIVPTWIELKVGTNKQSELQKSFQKMVEREGHKYCTCYSLECVQECFK
jgi:hypothetical protein